MRIDLRGDVPKKLHDLLAGLADGDDPELAELRRALGVSLSNQTSVAWMTAAEWNAVITGVEYVLNLAGANTTEGAELRRSALPKLQALAARTKRKEDLDTAAQERAGRRLGHADDWPEADQRNVR